MDERSRMTILYMPAFTAFLLIVIVKPGPSVPVSLCAFPAGKAAVAVSAKKDTTATMARIMRRTERLLSFGRSSYACPAEWQDGRLGTGLAEGEDSSKPP